MPRSSAAVLTGCSPQCTATATELGISRRTLYYKLTEYQKQGYAVD